MTDVTARAGGGDPELEERLRSQTAPAGGKEFRAALRAGFVAGQLAESGGESLSLRCMDARRAASVIENMLTQGAPPRPARAAFAQELRRRFVDGDLPGSVRGVEQSAPIPAPRRARPALRIVLAGLAAAAAILVLSLFVPSAPRWSALDVRGAGPLIVGGEELETWDASQLGGALEAGVELGTADRTVDFGFGRHLLLELRPGARIRAEAAPDGELRLHLLEGELYAKTDGAYDGPALVVRTHDLDMRMTGTVFGVMTDGVVTCVCVTRGQVELTTDGGREACPTNTFHRVWRDGSDMSVGTFSHVVSEIPEGDREHIGGLLEFMAAVGPLGF